jgi:S1-C subfamily serine protease
MTAAAPDLLSQLSDALAARAAAARAAVVGLVPDGAPPSSGILWQKDLVVASEQALPRRLDPIRVPLPDGAAVDAKLIGRDPGTNVALLRLAEPADVMLPPAGEPVLGGLVLLLGGDGAGGATVRLGVVRGLGPAWHSRAGGRIDRRITLDARLARGEEGGPVLDAGGRLIGMSARGPRGAVLVIPTATIARIVEPLLASGHVARGWLGLALQPVALADQPAGAGRGLMVMGVTPGSPAAKAGLLAGDILTALDGVATAHPARLAERLGPDSIGRQSELTLIRAGAPLALSLTIEAREAA